MGLKLFYLRSIIIYVRFKPKHLLCFKTNINWGEQKLSEQTSISIPPDVKSEAISIAKMRGESMSVYVTTAVRYYNSIKDFHIAKQELLKEQAGLAEKR